MNKWNVVLAWAVVLGSGCGGGDDSAEEKKESTCKLQLAVGSLQSGSFVALDSGDPVELVLGFQGIRMLQLTLQVKGTGEPSVDVISHLGIETTGQSQDQRDRSLTLVSDGDDASRVEEYLIFVNDVAASQAVGESARLELIARAGDCEGTLVRELQLRDDDDCVDFDIVLDGSVESAVPDGSVACGEAP